MYYKIAVSTDICKKPVAKKREISYLQKKANDSLKIKKIYIPKNKILGVSKRSKKLKKRKKLKK